MRRQILIHFLILLSICKLSAQQKEIAFENAKYLGMEPGVFMQQWLLLGPISSFQGESTDKDFDTQKAVFEQEQLPVKEYDNIKESKSINISGKTYQWKFLNSQDDIVDLDKQYNGVDFAIAYACADITMANPEKVLLGIGSDDGVKVWLNSFTKTGLHDQLIRMMTLLL